MTVEERPAISQEMLRQTFLDTARALAAAIEAKGSVALATASGSRSWPWDSPGRSGSATASWTGYSWVLFCTTSQDRHAH